MAMRKNVEDSSTAVGAPVGTTEGAGEGCIVGATEGAGEGIIEAVGAFETVGAGVSSSCAAARGRVAARTQTTASSRRFSNFIFCLSGGVLLCAKGRRRGTE